MIAEIDDIDDDDVNDAVDNFITELDATAKYYNLSGVRDDINKKLKTITTGKSGTFSLAKLISMVKYDLSLIFQTILVQKANVVKIF